MSAPRKNIPVAISDVQARASNPDHSAFVAANAGSGKTHVLVSRVIRLLLKGVSPEKILCITFTKAAAANMAQRVFGTLGHWVTLPDADLDAAIMAAGAARPDAQTRARARELFACALETPGGLKVQTIHALCTRLLQQFPFEANVPAHFAVLDDRDQNEMMERANLSVLLDAAAHPDSAAGHALNIAMAGAADRTFQEVVREACLSREHFMAWSDHAGDIATAMDQVSMLLGVSSGETQIGVEHEIVDGPHLPRSQWGGAAAVFDTGSDMDRKQSERLREASDKTGGEQVDAYLCLFLTGDLEPRKSLVTKKIRDSSPEFAQRLEREKERVLALVKTRRAVALRDRTQALLTIASSVAAHYRHEKQERGLLDYHDLIDRTYEMLDRVASGWVHYKLDRGVDHVLIDEAQDTSPKQWDIVERIIAEFTTGEGARDGVKRTIFAVGDEKQSIFSFQGAAPREFDSRRRDLKEKFEAAGLRFDPISFTYSFRSGESVLKAVSNTFKTQTIYQSITTDLDGMPPHLSLEDAAPSVVDLWELEKADEREQIEGWQAPFDARSETSPEVRLARRVQTEIQALMAARTMTGKIGDRRPLRYGDILILVRRRKIAFDAVLQALKHAGIPVAGADRLKLTEHIAVIDLMNLADALLLEHDDLALAVALKSPLFGLDDDDLLKIAPLRGSISLRGALAAHAHGDTRLSMALRRLKTCEERFAHDTPFAFFSWLLGGDSGRARILKRLGPEANDALDEFLELALNYERKAAASLQGFMAWLRAADTEVKRDMEIRRDEVRVMTVHGAKGLEAAVVFLIDTTASPTDAPKLNLIRLPPQGNAAPNTPSAMIWAGNKADDIPVVQTARGEMTEEITNEYRRLLYVAMTRAADRLIVGGCLPGNRKEVKPDCWYALVREGLAASDLDVEEIATTHGPVKRYRRTEDARYVEPATAEISAVNNAAHDVPAWLHEKIASASPSDAAVRPSGGMAGDTVQRGDAHERSRSEPSRPRDLAIARGTLVHRLLQSLPDMPRQRRRDAAEKFLERRALDKDGWTADARTTLAAQIVALIEQDTFASIFAEGSRAEVPVIGRIARIGKPDLIVSGQIDRLIVMADAIRIVDFKTNLKPPAQAPAAYVRQFALYRHVLGKVYPGRDVHCRLLWTQTLALTDVPNAALDEAMRLVLA